MTVVRQLIEGSREKVLRRFLKSVKLQASLMSARRLFQVLGAEMRKARWPYYVLVWVTSINGLNDDLSVRVGISSHRRLWRYAGVFVDLWRFLVVMLLSLQPLLYWHYCHCCPTNTTAATALLSLLPLLPVIRYIDTIIASTTLLPPLLSLLYWHYGQATTATNATTVMSLLY